MSQWKYTKKRKKGEHLTQGMSGHVHEKKALNMTVIFYQTARVQV